MKAKPTIARLAFATAALGAFASLLYAGSGPQYWTAAKPVATFSEAKKAGPDDIVTMQCKG